jgi:hypothetical protein
MAIALGVLVDDFADMCDQIGHASSYPPRTATLSLAALGLIAMRTLPAIAPKTNPPTWAKNATPLPPLVAG